MIKADRGGRCDSDATHLLVLGTGRLARALPEAYGAVRPLTRVTVWGRRRDAVAKTVRDLEARFPALTVDGAEELLQQERLREDELEKLERKLKPIMCLKQSWPMIFIKMMT